MGQIISSKPVSDGEKESSSSNNSANNNESNTRQMESNNENHNDQAVATDDEEMPIENNAPSNENNIVQHQGNEDESDTENGESQNDNDQAVATDDEVMPIENIARLSKKLVVAPYQGIEDESDSEDEEVPRIILMYKCYPLSSITATMAESHPASLILPVEALRLTTKYNAPCPLAFEVKNVANNKTTVCGVSEFTAKQGDCYIPDWIMENLGLSRGDRVLVTYVKLPLGGKVKFQAQSVDFLDVSDPKKVLQSALAKFHCISKEDIIPISGDGDGKVYKMKVVETEPADSICIRDIDLNVDFDPPVGYVEPKKEDSTETEVVAAYLNQTFVPFSGLGNRINGQPVERLQQPRVPNQRGIPDNSWEFGTINFIRKPKPSKNMSPGVAQKLTAFEGAGVALGCSKTIDHPPPDFDPSDEPPTKRMRTSDPPIGVIHDSLLGDDFEVQDEESEDSDMEIDEY